MSVYEPFGKYKLIMQDDSVLKKKRHGLHGLTQIFSVLIRIIRGVFLSGLFLVDFRSGIRYYEHSTFGRNA
jgi:hypothetical protein